MVSLNELSKREGVDLVDVAGINASWPMPVAIWNAPHGFDTSAQPDYQPCCVIALRLSGSLVQRVASGSAKRERLRPRGFSVHPPRRDLRFVAPSAIRFAHIYVSEAFLRNIAGQAAYPTPDEGDLGENDRVMYEDSEMMLNLESYVRRAFEATDRPTKFEMESRANLIALRLLQHSLGLRRDDPISVKGELAPWQVRRVCTYLEENFDRVVRLEELADLLGVSKEHLCRGFHRATGKPPVQWQLSKRMEAACRLLSTTQASLTSIAQDVGYAGQSSFGNAFRDIIGMTPCEYRRGHLSTND